MSDSPDQSSEDASAPWVRIARPSAWAERVRALGELTTIASAAILPFATESFAVGTAVLGLTLATWAGGAIAAARAEQRRPAQARVGAGGITIVTGGAIARDALESAEIISDAGALIVRLRTRDGHALDLEATSVDVALSWLDILGHGLDHRLLTVDAQPSPSMRSHRELRAQDVAAAVGLGTVAYASGLSMLALLAASAGTGLLMRSRTTLRIGADGVEQVRGRRRRFHAFDEIIAAEVGDDEVVLRKRDGTRVVLDVTARLGDMASQHRALIAALIQRALQRRHASSRAAVEASLARREDDAATWASTLVAPRTGDGYRHAAVDRDAIAAVLDDPTADARARVAAARWLAHHDEPSRAIVMEAAQRTANPRVRVALEAAAERDDEALRRIAAELPDAPATPVMPRGARRA